MKITIRILIYLFLGSWLTFQIPLLAVEQVVKKGGTGAVHTGSGDINIGYTIEEHEEALREREATLRQDLEQFHQLEKKTLSLEKQLLEKKLADVEHQLADLDKSYQQRIAFLETTIQELRTFAGEIDGTLLSKAETALLQGDTDQADQLFQQIEEKEQSAINRAAKAAFERGKIAKANIDYRKSFRHFARAVGLSPENPLYLEYAGSMAGTVAKHQKEIEWNEKALSIYLKQKSLIAVTRLQNALGIAWDSLGHYEKAIEFYEKGLASDLKTYGEDHPKVATYRNNLGNAWYSLGQYEKAIEFYEKALASDLKTYGEDHPDVAIRWNNLGIAWKELGQYDKAIEFYEKALASDLKTFGEDHPKIAIRWNNLGNAWSSLGHYEKAIEFYEKALASDLKTYGEDHPDVAIDWNNLGSAWRALGHYEKAMEFYEKALKVFQNRLGLDHPKTKMVQRNLDRVRKK